MEVKQSTRTVAQAENDELEHIHLPPPSWAPIILALGMAGIVFGIVLTPILLVAGVVVMLFGLGMWIMDEVRNASAADAHADSGTTPDHPA